MPEGQRAQAADGAPVGSGRLTGTVALGGGVPPRVVQATRASKAVSKQGRIGWAGSGAAPYARDHGLP